MNDKTLFTSRTTSFITCEATCFDLKTCRLPRNKKQLCLTFKVFYHSLVHQWHIVMLTVKQKHYKLP